MPTPDIWIQVLPVIYGAIWGTQAYFDPAATLSIGPADSQIVGGLGGIVKANNKHEDGAGEGTLAYVYGWKAFGFQPKLMSFVTSRGDVVVGAGLQNEIVFKKLSLTSDGSTPFFFSWAAAPSIYLPGPRPRGNYGHTFQFQMTDELGFYVGKSMRVSFAFNHYSDGGFTDINPNGNAFTLNLGYRF
jgi:hypothetical protein